MTGCQGNGVGRCHWGLRRSVFNCFTVVGHADTCTQTHFRMHTKHRGARAEVISCALLREALFSVCSMFSARWLCFLLFSLQMWPKRVNPVGYLFTFVTRSLSCFFLTPLLLCYLFHTYIKRRSTHKCKRLKNLNTHTQSQPAEGSQLGYGFPPPAQGHRDKTEGELLLEKGGKEEAEKKKEIAKASCGLWTLREVQNQQEVRGMEEELGEGGGRWRLAYTAGDVALVQASPCDLLTPFKSLNH